MSDPVVQLPSDKNGIRLFPDVAYLNGYGEIAIRRFSPTRKRSVSLSILSANYSWQGIEITNSIQSIVFGRSTEKMKIAELLCRKAAGAFAEAANVNREIERLKNEENV